jgi:hypothetical protein
MATAGSFSVAGASGANDDVFAFHPGGLGSTTVGSFGPGLVLDGSLYGLSSFALDGFQLDSSLSPTFAERSAAFASIYADSPMLASTVGDELAPAKAKSKPGTEGKSAAKSDKNALMAITQKSKHAKKKSIDPDCGCSTRNAEPTTSDIGNVAKKSKRKGR